MNWGEDTIMGAINKMLIIWSKLAKSLTAGVVILTLGAGLQSQEITADKWHEEASRLILKEDHEAALLIVEKRLKAEPVDPQALFMKGKLLDSKRSFAEAVEVYAKLLEQEDALPLWQRAELHHIRADALFKSGEFHKAVSEYDRSIALQPARAPRCWQRGIALYYAGRFQEGRAQFELYQTYNKNDVENAVWHFLCVAREESLEKARSVLIPIKGDPRSPMTEIHELFAGKCLPKTVLEAANRALGANSVHAQFYAHLYLSLYYEAIGDRETSFEHISKAVEDYESFGTMGEVARIQKLTLGRYLKTTPPPSQPKAVPSAMSPFMGPVKPFALLDHLGKFHSLNYHADDPQTKWIVLFVQGNGCPLVRKRIPELKELQSEFASKGVRFRMINANFQDERSDIIEEATAFDIHLPILIDDAQLVAESLDLKRTAEALLIRPSDGTIAFRGPIDDRLTYETEKPKADNHYLRNALESVLTGESVEHPYVVAPGCLISYPIRDKHTANPVSYSKDIVPILQSQCIQCHQKGGIAPWSMTSHRRLLGWSDMIEETLMTMRMPPWHADPHFGEFSNDTSLSPEEKAKLVHWIRDGAVKVVDEPDPLAAVTPEQTPWSMGTPDQIIDVPVQGIPASGIVDYRYLTVASPFEEDVWIRGVDIQPGNVKVLHHLIAFIAEDAEDLKKRDKWLAGYAPGTGPEMFPEGTAILLKKGAHLLFELHYTVTGRPESDASEVGLYLASSPPSKDLKTDIILDNSFRIPPHERAHRHVTTRNIPSDVTVYSLFPHMHFRGKSMKFTLHKPLGDTSVILSVPNYDFNWQRGYDLVEPLHIPGGSRLEIEAVWDNSSLNPANPDPTAEVRWGEQTFEEMLFATLRYTLDK